MQRAFKSPPPQLTVNQAAGIAVHAAADIYYESVHVWAGTGLLADTTRRNLWDIIFSF
jgi:hypothetical protein